MRVRSANPANLVPLTPQRKWRAITVATVVLAPAFWSLMVGLVAAGSREPGRPAAAPAIAFGLCLIPFVFIVLAFASEHPTAPSAAVKAMGMCLLIGIPVSAFAGDAVSEEISLPLVPQQPVEPRQRSVLGHHHQQPLAALDDLGGDARHHLVDGRAGQLVEIDPHSAVGSTKRSSRRTPNAVAPLS